MERTTGEGVGVRRGRSAQATRMPRLSTFDWALEELAVATGTSHDEALRQAVFFARAHRGAFVSFLDATPRRSASQLAAALWWLIKRFPSKPETLVALMSLLGIAIAAAQILWHG